MNFSENKFTVDHLVTLLKDGSLESNAEYQRGEEWSQVQKAGFVDSVFRGYPLPSLFWHVIPTSSPDDSTKDNVEIVDGQQRLKALRDFRDNKFRLLAVSGESKLRLPKGVREQPAPWAGRWFDDLDVAMMYRFLNAEINVTEIRTPCSDEIRDLFVRLQSGTALTRQQKRDAYPGPVGPYVERLAGKLAQKPSHPLFRIIDKRGTRSEDESMKDHRVTDRQFCAQLLKIFLARQSDPCAFPSVSANALDELYHESTDFDAAGPTAKQFWLILTLTWWVLELVSLERNGKSVKYRRLGVTALMMYYQDLQRVSQFRFDRSFHERLAKRLVEAAPCDEPKGKSTSGYTLQRYYEWWRANIAVDMESHLDDCRALDRPPNR